MGKSLIAVKKGYFLYNKKEYEFDEIRKLPKSKLHIVILEEELYAKIFSANLKKNKVCSFIEEKIADEFPQSVDILYDYDQNKKENIVAIYSLKGGKRIEKICEIANELQIIPIQFVIISSMKKILGKKLSNLKTLIKFDGYYYYVCLKKGIFYYGFVEKEKNTIINRICEVNNDGELYVDSKIYNDVDLGEKFKLIKIDLEDLLNDQIYKKQELYS